jgi:RNA polymerase sigma-70 factor (ECF subfamily)
VNPPLLPGVSGLIRESRHGNREALGKLLDLYAVCLKKTAAAQLRGPLQARLSASDVVQETCLEAHAHFDQFAGATEREFAAWLGTIFKHKVLGAMRTHVGAQKRAIGLERGEDNPLVDALPSNQSTASGRLMRAEDVLNLARALESLPPDQREAVRLHYLHGYTLTQLAEHFGRSLTAAAGLLKRGLYGLRAALHAAQVREADA